MKENKVFVIPKAKVVTIALAIYLLLAPLDFIPVFEGASLTRILIILPLLASLIYFKQMKVRFNTLLGTLALFLLFLIISLLYSSNITISIERFITITLNIGMIFFLSMISYDENELRLLKKAIIYSGWFTILLMLIYSSGTLMMGRFTVIVNGIYQDPNYLTGFFIFSTIFYYDDLIRKKNIVSLIKFLVFITAVFFTGSRGGLIAIIGAILAYTLMWLKTSKLNKSLVASLLTIVISVVLVSAVIINIIPNNAIERFTVQYTIDDRGANRFDIWNSIILNYSESPTFQKIFGWGLGTIREHNYFHLVAHNIWLESLIEIGIFGTILFGLLYYSFIKKSYNIKEFVATASFVGYILMGLSMSLYSYKPIWNILLIIFLLNNFQKRKLSLASIDLKK